MNVRRVSRLSLIGALSAALTVAVIAALLTIPTASAAAMPVVTNPVGTVVAGVPGSSQTWTLGSFDTTHAVTFTEGTDCFGTVLGCPLDNWSASISWGDSKASSMGTVLCHIPPLPGPGPTPVVTVTAHCTIQGTHTYMTRPAARTQHG